MKLSEVNLLSSNELSRGSVIDSSEVESAESAFITSVLISIELPLKYSMCD